MLGGSRNACVVPISDGMHRPERFDDGHELGNELPDLPIPRPGEGAAEHAPQPSPIAAPRLAGGASFTAAGGAEHAPPIQVDAAPQLPPHAPPAELGAPDRERIETERFTWELAARLTAGMLANPARNHASVKDAMAMFDQFLQEMHAYGRISSEFGVLAGDGERRRHHAEYFQGTGAEEATTTAPPAGAMAAAAAAAKPEPIRPRPMPGYQPLPPGSRSYVPGSMAGAPPPGETASGEADEDAA